MRGARTTESISAAQQQHLRSGLAAEPAGAAGAAITGSAAADRAVLRAVPAQKAAARAVSTAQAVSWARALQPNVARTSASLTLTVSFPEYRQAATGRSLPCEIANDSARAGHERSFADACGKPTLRQARDIMAFAWWHIVRTQRGDHVDVACNIAEQRALAAAQVTQQVGAARLRCYSRRLGRDCIERNAPIRKREIVAFLW